LGILTLGLLTQAPDFRIGNEGVSRGMMRPLVTVGGET